MQKMIQSIRSFVTTRGTVILREGNMADAPQFRDLRLNGLLDAPTAFSADYQVNFSHPMSFWEGRLNFDEYGMIFFAEHEGGLIGMTGIRIGESPKTKHGAYVWGVYVRPAWRGLHIAEQLIDICLEWARERNVVIAKLGVMANNEPAIRCYTRMGFSIYGTEPRALFHDSQYYDEYLMSFNLDSQKEKS
jgi:ribosomal protein S18 acetylase RimI-like enzyme